MTFSGWRPLDERAQVVPLVRVPGTPDLVEQLALGDQTTSVLDQDLDEVPLGWGHPDLGLVTDDPLGGEVDGEGVGGDDQLLLWRRGAAEGGADSSDSVICRSRGSGIAASSDRAASSSSAAKSNATAPSELMYVFVAATACSSPASSGST